MSCLHTKVPHLAASLIAAGLLSSPVLAETLQVGPNAPLTTIQAGIDEAKPGDTIQIAKGTYLENLTIPVELDGLQLIAKGQVLLDARPEGDAGTGPGLFVQADDVFVRGLTIRHAAPGNALDGVGILTTGVGLDVFQVTIEHCQDGGVLADGAEGLTVRGSTFVANGGPAVRAEGALARLESNRVERNGGGLQAFGDGAVVSRNTLTGIDGTAVLVEGEQALLSRNTVRLATGGGLAVQGPAATLERNRVEAVDGAGLSALGSGSRIERNQVAATGGAGLLQEGGDTRIEGNRLTAVGGTGIASSGKGLVIDRNKLTGVGGAAIQHAGPGVSLTDNSVRDVFGGAGLDVTSEDGLVAGNRVQDVTGTGIHVGDGSHAAQVLDNRVDRVGADGGDGLRVEGHGLLAQGNQVRGAGRDGLHADGDDLLLLGNTLRDCGEDGLDLESGDGAEVRDNKALKNRAEGIEIGGSNATVSDNTAQGNRTDFAESGGVAVFSGNQAGDGTDAEPGKPQIDS